MEGGKTTLAAAQELGVTIESLCGGKHTRGKGKVRVAHSDFTEEFVNAMSLAHQRDDFPHLEGI